MEFCLSHTYECIWMEEDVMRLHSSWWGAYWGHMTSQRASRLKQGALGVFVACLAEEGSKGEIFPLSDILSVNLWRYKVIPHYLCLGASAASQCWWNGGDTHGVCPVVTWPRKRNAPGHRRPSFDALILNLTENNTETRGNKSILLASAVCQPWMNDAFPQLMGPHLVRKSPTSFVLCSCCGCHLRRYPAGTVIGLLLLIVCVRT